jgi:hypothetical protein
MLVRIKARCGAVSDRLTRPDRRSPRTRDCIIADDKRQFLISAILLKPAAIGAGGVTEVSRWLREVKPPVLRSQRTAPLPRMKIRWSVQASPRGGEGARRVGVGSSRTLKLADLRHHRLLLLMNRRDTVFRNSPHPAFGHPLPRMSCLAQTLALRAGERGRFSAFDCPVVSLRPFAKGSRARQRTESYLRRSLPSAC